MRTRYLAGVLEWIRIKSMRKMSTKTDLSDKSKFINDKEENARAHAFVSAQFEIAKIGLIELVNLLEQACNNISDISTVTKLYANYLSWDTDITIALLKLTDIEHYKNWLLVERFNAGPNIFANLDKLRSILYKKDIVLREAIKNAKSSVIGSIISKLTLVRADSGSKYEIVINEQYLTPIKVDAIKTWSILLDVAEKKDIHDSGNKSALDYFNTNKNCRLYSKTGYKPTKILKVENGYIVPAIELEVISTKAFRQRQNKAA